MQLLLLALLAAAAATTAPAAAAAPAGTAEHDIQEREVFELTLDGRLEDALAICEAAVASGAASPATVVRLGLLAADAFPDRLPLARAALEAELAGAPLQPRQRVSAQLALARVEDAQGDHAAAWERAAAAKRALAAPGAPDTLTRLLLDMRAVRDAFTPEVMFAARSGSAAVAWPLFVVGQPRSGTTLLEHLLCAHPHVEGRGELSSAQVIWESLRSDAAAAGRTVRQQLLQASRGDMQRLALRAWTLNGGDPAPGVRRVVFKLPWDFARLPLLRLLFPAAAFVHLGRDSRDVAVSTMLTDFSTLDRGLGYSTAVADIAAYAAAYRRSMRFVERELGGLGVLHVGYTALVRDTEAQLARVAAHAGLEWSDEISAAVMVSSQPGRRVKTASLMQVRGAVHDRSVGRWRSYAAELEPLVSLLGSCASPDWEGQEDLCWL